MSSLAKRYLVLPFAAVVIAACSDATGANAPAAVSLSFATRSSAAALASAAPITVVGNGSTLVINRIQAVLGEIELEPVDLPDCAGGGEGGECPELKLDPVLVELPLDGVATLDLGAVIPAGTYKELEFEIDAVESAEANGAPFLAAHPEFRGISIRVEGTYNGQPFVFTTNLDTEIELEFESGFAVTGTPSNLTVAVDVATWFKDATGALLDPRSTENAGRIGDNIKVSFRVFEDDDRDGIEDRR
jgi:hypothetical protein